MKAKLRRLLSLLLGASALAGGGWLLASNWPLRVRASSPAPDPSIDTTGVRRGTFRLSLSAAGKLQARTTVSVRTEQMMGKLVWIATDGAPIKKGDLLARLDDDEFKRTVRDTTLEYENAKADIEKTDRDRALEQRNSQAAVDKANAEMEILRKSNAVQLKQAQDQLDFSTADLERLTTQYQRNKRQQEEKLIPLATLEQAEIQMNSAAFQKEKAEKDLKLQQEKAASAVQQKMADIENAKFTVATAQRRSKNDARSALSKLDDIKRRLDDATQKLSWCTIRAPASGLLVLAKDWHDDDSRRVARPGDQLRPFAPLADIPDLAVMAVNCKIPEREVGAVHVGQPVAVRLDERPTQPFHGRVARISSVAEAVSPWDDAGFDVGTKVFTVTIEIRERDSKRLLPGMSASLEIIARSIPNSVYLAKSCVFDRGADHVVYVRRGGAFEPVVVTPGEENATQVRIRKGLKGGESVATEDPTRVGNGD